jgi:alkyldihydroxyacetonephosphate synthase
MGFDGWREIVDCQEKRASDLCYKYGAQDLGREPGNLWWEHRYDFYFPPGTLDFPWMFGTMDTMATFDKIENLYWTKKQAIEEGYADWDVRYIAHFSHWYPYAAMVYDRFIIEEPPQDPEQAIKLHNEIWDLGVNTSLECGGVINEHHGVGLKLARHVRSQYGSAYQILEALKDGLDPYHLFNPGKMGFGPPKSGETQG